MAIGNPPSELELAHRERLKELELQRMAAVHDRMTYPIFGISPPPPGVLSYPLAADAKSEASFVTYHIGTDTQIDDPKRLLMQRLRRKEIPASLFEHINIAVMSEKTFVSFYKDNEMTTLEDSTAMFPSDNFVNAVRLLLG